MARRKGNRSVRLDERTVDVLNALCDRFGESQTKIVDSAVRRLADEYGNAKTLPVYSQVSVETNNGSIHVHTVPVGARMKAKRKKVSG